jgi:hypothetical protein
MRIAHASRRRHRKPADVQGPSPSAVRPDFPTMPTVGPLRHHVEKTRLRRETETSMARGDHIHVCRPRGYAQHRTDHGDGTVTHVSGEPGKSKIDSHDCRLIMRLTCEFQGTLP